MLVFSICFALWAALANARAARLPRTEMHRRQQADPPSTICGDIVDSVNEGYLVFWASDAFDCLRSVPFNDAVALRFIDYYNQTMQFQTTWSLLKNPPEGYQQPAVDLQQGLADLRNNVTNNVYKNQYAFESDLQYLIYQVHDTHVDLSAGVLAAFTFGSPYSIMSASIDGKQEPKLWIEDDILDHANNPGGFEPSPIALINGEDPVEYLTRFAAINSQGTLEPHADWNQLMGSPAMDIQGSVSSFAGGATFYPGDELNFTMANGTIIPANWVAVYNELYFTGPLVTGGDFYNYFVLGLLPASYDDTPLPDFFNSSANWEAEYYLEEDDTFMANWSDITPAYPEDPIVVQDGLYVASDQVVTGYLLPDISTGVLSLPTFNQFDTAKETFIDAITNLIQNATSHGMERLVIDVQQNWGGDPFAGSHKRSHLMADVLGTTFTEYWDRLSIDDEDEVDGKLELMGREWVVTPRINAETEQNFTSWEEYAGPVAYGEDSFSKPERYNLSNVNFDMAEFGGWIPMDYVEPPTEEQPYSASNIVILTDGLCASTCALFVEMMTQAGVRTVVVGGRPEAGPMQAASGTRAAAMYTAAALDDDFVNATDIVALNGDYRPSNDSLVLLNALPRDTGMWVNSAGFSLRDQVRSADDPEPLQLKYQPADCRLYWTLDNVVNFTRLWTDVATVTWEDSGRCVAGSTSSRSTTTNDNNSPPPPPPRLYDAAPPKPVVAGTDFDPSRAGLANEAPGSLQITSLLQTTRKCDLDDLATYGYDNCGKDLGLHCAPVNAKDKSSRAGYCVSTCSSTDQACLVADQQCKLSKRPLQLESKGLRAANSGGSSRGGSRTTSIYPGHCRPVKTKTKQQKLGGGKKTGGGKRG
ncbi:hypothetical protein PG991_010654 [Apiospora marii]|uniref:CPAF-like PDZ domain-containing protein n=1 Tax=Apiospora marii TaxID=335849 RepID=A0ABR1RCZ3_9PEZI